MSDALAFSALLASGRASGAEQGAPAERETAVCLAWAPRPGAGCPTAKETETAVAEIVGHRLSSQPSCDIQVNGSMRRLDGGGWEADLSFVKSNGETLGDRTLQSQDARCAALKDPLSLVIALMVEGREAQATLHVPVTQPSQTSVAKSNVVSANLSVSSGLLPNLGFGATIGFGANLGRWLPLRLDSTYWFPGSSEPAGPGGRFWAWQAGAGLCPAMMKTTTVQGALCAKVEGGAIRGTGLGLDYHESATKPYGAGEAYAMFSFPLFGTLAGFVQFGVAVPWLRPRFVYLDASSSPVEIHRPHAAIVFGGFGVEFGSGRARVVAMEQ